MKKIIIMMVIALMATTNVSAQNAFEPKHDIAISVGAWSNSDIINVFEDMLTIMLTGSNVETSSYFGPISLEYFYHLNRTISVGAIAAYGHMKQNFYLTGCKRRTSVCTLNSVSVLPFVVRKLNLPVTLKKVRPTAMCTSTGRFHFLVLRLAQRKYAVSLSWVPVNRVLPSLVYVTSSNNLYDISPLQWEENG